MRLKFSLLSLLPLLLLPVHPIGLHAAETRDLHAPQGPRILEGRKVALVVGNGAYQAVGRLAQAPQDARAVAAALRKDGFSVVEKYDLGNQAFARAVADFETALSGAEVGFFYYAGHAVQVVRRGQVRAEPRFGHGLCALGLHHRLRHGPRLGGGR